MKKCLIAIPFLALGLSLSPLAVSTTVTPAYATEESEVVEESESVLTEESELTEEGFIAQTKAFLSKYLDEQLVLSIINWAIDVGLLTALFGVYLKYRKYKSMSSKEIAQETKTVVENAVKAKMQELTAVELEKIYKVVSNLEEGLKTTNKALVLAQDKTAEGKIALLNLISEKSSDSETKEKADEVKTKIVEEEETKEEVNKDVSGDYNSIF